MDQKRFYRAATWFQDNKKPRCHLVQNSGRYVFQHWQRPVFFQYLSEVHSQGAYYKRMSNHYPMPHTGVVDRDTLLWGNQIFQLVICYCTREKRRTCSVQYEPEASFPFRWSLSGKSQLARGFDRIYRFRMGVALTKASSCIVRACHGVRHPALFCQHHPSRSTN